MGLDATAMQRRGEAPRTGACVVWSPYSKGGDQCAQPVAERQSNRMQVILQAERREEVTLNIDIAPKVGFHKTQRTTSEEHGTNHARVAAHQGEPRFRFVQFCPAESDGGAVPQAQREAAVEAVKQALQQLRHFGRA